MSDLLLMASSPLRQLLSTSGLVACYLPWLQIAQSATGQTLLDYSGNGNHAQLGSTTGVDANDPSWGTNALSFGGDDYCDMPDFGNGDMTAFTVWKQPSEQPDASPGLWSRNNIICYGATSKRLLYTDINSASQTTPSIGNPADTWLFGVARASASGYLSWSSISIGTFVDRGVAMHPTYKYWKGRLGAYQERCLACDIACHVMFNRVLTDGEAMRARSNIVTLMASQGISL